VHSAAARRWRSLCWPVAGPADGVETIYFDRYDVFGANKVAAISDRRAREQFAAQNHKWRYQDDVIYRVQGDITIEPGHSLAYLPGRRLIEPLRGVHDELVPSLLRSTFQRALAAPVRHFDALLHFDGFLGQNLWHFFADALHGLLLVDKSGLVAADMPILIHQRIWSSPLARLVLNRPPFNDRNWVVQEDRSWITTSCLYKATASQAYFRQSYELLAPLAEKKPHRSIFLDRRSRYGRRVSNKTRLDRVLDKHGFETIFAEDLAYAEQIELLAQVKNIIGIHGAGLTNLLFADIPSVRCLEILPQGYVNPHYYWLLQITGAQRYDAIVGSELDANTNFAIDPRAFERQVELLLA
jgi:glycosyl transferase family 61